MAGLGASVRFRHRHLGRGVTKGGIVNQAEADRVQQEAEEQMAKARVDLDRVGCMDAVIVVALALAAILAIAF